jgi:DNA repair protein RecO (recombination protein O)
MIISTKAIILSKLKYKDHDLIVRAYTASNGVVSFLVKGTFSSKKTKIKPAYFQSLSLLNLEIDYKNSRDLHYIKNVRLQQVYSTLHTDILKSTCVIFLAEILTMVLKEEAPNEDLFNYIEAALLWFDTIDCNSIFHHQFLIGLTKYVGFYPELSNPTLPFFNLEAGLYQAKNTGRYCISGSKLILFNSILGMEFDSYTSESMNSGQKQELLNMILLYFKLHLQGFKSPKSLVILNQVFN